MRFVLLHSPLLGPSSWRAVAAALHAAGHTAEAAAWPRLSSVSSDFYRTLADSLAGGLPQTGEPPLLVAHSGAGALIPALSARLGHVSGVVFCDAILPHPGQSWFDTAPAEMRAHLRSGAEDGRLPAWDQWWPPGALDRLVPDDCLRERLLAELEPLPVDYFEEPAPEAAYDGPQAYLRLSGAYETEAMLAGRQGWPVVRLPLNHLAILTQPDAVAAAVASLAAALPPSGK
ncbi:alpha/beta fold hydrolase [Phenylobacterium sp.]|jgi:hypothetical protein|uniref:alpha/beta fold hydrolase n=1 Tax=Phenylobacterium sp. TaxID=1871053 RepID=UPI002F9338FE